MAGFPCFPLKQRPGKTSLTDDTLGSLLPNPTFPTWGIDLSQAETERVGTGPSETQVALAEVGALVEKDYICTYILGGSQPYP